MTRSEKPGADEATRSATGDLPRWRADRSLRPRPAPGRALAAGAARRRHGLLATPPLVATLSAACLTLAVALAAAPALATPPAGTVLGSVTDTTGHHLAGAVVVLSGPAGPIERRSDEEGRFAIADLAAGNYSLVAQHSTFERATYEPVAVRAGRVTTVRIQLAESVEETLVVTTEPPSGAPVPEAALLRLDAELPRIAAADDPWQNVGEAAGVVVAAGPLRRGEASARGAAPRDNVYLVDGVEVASADRPAPAYFDVAAGGGVELRTGTAARAVAGASLDLVTRQGGGDGPRLALRGSLTDRALQATAAAGEEQLTSRIQSVVDVSADGGATLVDDRLFAWGTYGVQRVSRQAVGGQVEEATSEHAGGRLDSRLGTATQLALSYHRGDRDAEGSGAALDRSFEATLRELSPSRVTSGELSHLFPTALLTLRGSTVESDTWLTPLGGDGADIVLAADGQWQGGFGSFHTARHTDSWESVLTTDGRSAVVDHETELGYLRRDSHAATSERWGRDGLVHLAGENFGTPYDLVRLSRDADLSVDTTGNHFWLQETVRRGALTFAGGVRHDVESGRDRSPGASANPLFPDLLPAVVGGGDDVEWSSVSPRLSLAWAPGEAERTVLRAGYASYAARLQPDLVEGTDPALAAALVAYDDLDGDGRFSRPEARFVLDSVGLGADVAPTTRAAGDLDPERTDERVLAIEHRRDAWLAAVEHVDRTTSNVLEVHPTVRDASGIRVASRDDYRLAEVLRGQLPDGSPYAVPVYELRPGIAATGEWLLDNGDRSQRYSATTLRLERAMSAGWMLRGNVTWSDWRWHLGHWFTHRDDPTDLAPTGAGPTDDDGGVVAPRSSDGRILINSRWSFDVVASRQVARRRAWGFDLGLAIHGREGFPVAYSATTVDPTLGVRSVQATPEVDTYRLDDLLSVDLRLAKDLQVGPLRLTVLADVFNLLDADTVLERETSLASPQADRVRETQNPRVIRFGLRLGLD